MPRSPCRAECRIDPDFHSAIHDSLALWASLSVQILHRTIFDDDFQHQPGPAACEPVVHGGHEAARVAIRQRRQQADVAAASQIAAAARTGHADRSARLN
jgi:hypothetical protein